MLTFDESTHTFRRDGQVVPSVTQILKACGLVRDYGPSTWARDRGTRVHQAMFALSTTNEDAALACLEPEDVPYFDAAQTWMVTNGVTVLGAEEVVDAGYYAGWLDLRCTLRGVSGPCVVDFKTGTLPPWAGLQLAAYAAPLGEVHTRYAVRLQSNGQPQMKLYTNRNDLINFNACARVVQLQADYGRD